jgi:hypothetical protein
MRFLANVAGVLFRLLVNFCSVLFRLFVDLTRLLVRLLGDVFTVLGRHHITLGRTQVSGQVVFILLVVAACLFCSLFALADTVLRDIGILSAHTATPTATYTATPTSTFIPTPTPTNTPAPLPTSTPTDTPTPLPTSTLTDTPTPLPTDKPSRLIVLIREDADNSNSTLGKIYIRCPTRMNTNSSDISKYGSYHQTILVRERMKVKLSSPSFEIESMQPTVQRVNIHDIGEPTSWVWTIKAPDTLGRHVLTLSVHSAANNMIMSPSWIVRIAIEVVEVTPAR